MSELPGLPPFGAQPVFTADDAAYGAIAGRARARRHTRLAAASAAAAVAVLVATVSGPRAAERTGLEPTTDAPSPTATGSGPTTDPSAQPSSSPGASGAPGGPAGSPAPGGSGGSGGSGGTPAPEPTGDAGEPGGQPTDGPHVVSDCVDENGDFVACDDDGQQPQPRLKAQWRQTATYVDDRVTEKCAPSAPGEGWCFRFLGPVDTTAGTETTFTAELCRQPNGRDEPVIHFQYDANDELALSLVGEGDGDDDTADPMALSYLERREVPHSRTIASGRCLRWTVTWNGVGDDGRVLPPGAYTLTVLTNGHTPRTPLPGEADRSDRRAHGVLFIDFRIR